MLNRDTTDFFILGEKESMSQEEKILTLHPAGKKGVNISKAKYEQMKDALLTVIKQTGPIRFTPLMEQVTLILEDNFEGSIMWYGVSVKQDLEARGILRVEKSIITLV